MDKLKSGDSPKILYFGLDFLRFSILNKKEYPALDILFSGLSKNSPYTEFNFFGANIQARYIETKEKNILNLDHEGFFICTVEKIKSLIAKDIVYIVEFWGLAFLKDEVVGKMIPNLEKYLGRDNYKITRIDICLDLTLSVPEVLKGVYRNNRKGSTYYSALGEVETQYLGKKGANKRHFVRVYDKLLDTDKKSKMGYYSHYFAYDHVTRIEAQLNADSCRNYDVDFLVFTDQKELKRIFGSLTKNRRINDFPILHNIDFGEVYRPSKRDKLQIDNLHSIKMLRAYADKLREQGIDPHVALAFFSSAENATAIPKDLIIRHGCATARGR
jgi:hypothetical protein